MPQIQSSFERELQEWRQQFRRLVLVRGMCWCVAAGCLTALVLGLTDFLLRPVHPGWRWILTGSVLAVVLLAAWRVILRPLREEFDPLKLARLVESLQPGSKGELSMAAELAARQTTPVEPDSIVAGLWQRSEKHWQQHPVEHLLASDASSRPLGWMLGSLAILVLLAVVAGGETWAAVHRLAFPWKPLDWPQYDWLVLVDEQFQPLPGVLVVEAGEPLRLQIIDERGAPPETLQVFQRSADGTVSRTQIQPRLIEQPGGSVRWAGTLDLIPRESLELRIEGGDDRRMTWQQIEVFHPPRVERYRISVVPPAYTNLPPREFESVSGQVECLLGSRIEVTAIFDQPVRDAWLRRQSFPAEVLELTHGDRRATAAWLALEAGRSRYQFEVLGTPLERRSVLRPGEVVVTADAAPTVVLERPRGSLLVTETSSIPVEFTVRDDLGIQDVVTAYSLSMSVDPEALSLPTDLQRLDDRHWVGSARMEPAMVGAVIGDRVSLWIEARDAFDLGPPHVTRSPVRTLNVVSADDKRAELHARLDEVIQQLRALRDLQADSPQLLSELRIQWRTVGSLRSADFDLIRKVNYVASVVGTELFDAPQSVLVRLEEMQQELVWNQLEESELSGPLVSAVTQVSRLKTWEFPSLVQSLSTLPGWHDREVSSPSQQPSEWESLIDQAWHAQQEISRTIDAVLEILGGFRRFGSLHETLNRLRHRQEAIYQETLGTARVTLGRPWEELTLQQQADLGRLVERQQRLQADLLALQADLQTRLSVTDPLTRTGDPERELLVQLADRQLEQWMAEAAERLSRNDLGRALPLQEQILARLENLAAIPRRELERDGRPGRLSPREVETRLTSLRDQQQELLETVRAAEDQVDAESQTRWITTQIELAEQMERVLPAEGANALDSWERSARSSLARMRQSERALVRGTWGRALEIQQAAVEDLSRALNQLAEHLAASQQAETRQEILALAGRLDTLLSEQRDLVEFVMEIDAAQSALGRWDRDLLRQVRDAAARQQGLADSTAEVVTSTWRWPAFTFALDNAMQLMHSSAVQLEQRRTGADTQALQVASLRLLEQVRNALTGDETSAIDSTLDPRDETVGERPHDPEGRLSQIKLLRELQADLLERTSVAIPSGEVTRSPSSGNLARQQRELSDLAKPVLEVFLDLNSSEVDEPADPTADLIRDAAREALEALDQAALELEADRFTSQVVEWQTRGVAALDRLLAAATHDERRPRDDMQLAGPGESDPGDQPSTPTEEGAIEQEPTAGSSTAADGSGGTAGDEAELEVIRARDRQLVSEVWGHLPPREQQQLLGDFSAEFVPEYESWIRRYYEALAEQK